MINHTKVITQPDLANGLKTYPLVSRRRERRGKDIVAALQPWRPADADFVDVIILEKSRQRIFR
jgi:hypothetical protein